MSLNENSVLKIANEHERRITKIESNQEQLKLEFTEIKDMISEGNKKQEEKLDLIDSRLMDEFFHKRRSSHEAKLNIFLKVIGGLVGGGSFIYLIIEKFL